MSLEAQATRTLEAEIFFPPASQAIKIVSQGGLITSSTLRSVDGTKSEVIPAVREPSQQLGLPLLLAGDYRSKEITLLNVDAAPANVEVIASDQHGRDLQRTFLFPLWPMASHSFSVQDLFSSASLQQLAIIRVISDRSIVGLQMVASPDADLVGLPALTTTSQAWAFPIVASGGDFELWTSIGLFNPVELPISLTVEAFDTENNALGIIDQVTLSQEERILSPQRTSKVPCLLRRFLFR